MHVESHLSKKQPQATIAIAFLFSQLHFNVTPDALFHGCHLVFHNNLANPRVLIGQGLWSIRL